MNSRQKNILKILSNSFGKKITSQALSDELEVSVRTIKSDVKLINEQYDGLIKSSNKGYSIEESDLAKLSLTTDDNLLPQSPLERVRFIINYLLTDETKYSIFDFSDFLYVSTSTIQNDLELIKDIILRYNLTLSTKDSFLKIEGSENHKRKLLVDLLYDELEMDFFSLKKIDELFPSIDTKYIKEVFVATLNKHGYLINDFGLYSSIIHICVRIDRMQKGHDELLYEPIFSENEVELEIAEEILTKLEEHFQVSFNEVDYHEMATLIISKIHRFDASNAVNQKIQESIDPKTMELAHSIIQSINQHFLVDIGSEEFVLPFAIHIQNLQKRVQNNEVSHNPLTRSIKYSSPIIYEVAVFASNIIKDAFDFILDEGEVAFIAIHIGSALEFQKMFETKINTYLVIPAYYSYSKNLIKRINDLYHNQLNINKVISSFDYLSESENPDLIISILPKPLDLIDVPWLEISLFFTSNDQLLIDKKIEELQHKFKQEEFSSQLEVISSPDLFFTSDSKDDTMIDVLQVMADQLIKLDYVEDDFLQKVLKRENLSSTAYVPFAIPHSIDMDAKQTMISIYINPNGIKWNGKSVQLVILPCFTSADRKSFNQIFDIFTDTLVNTLNINSLINTSTLQEFTAQLKLLL